MTWEPFIRTGSCVADLFCYLDLWYFQLSVLYDVSQAQQAFLFFLKAPSYIALSKAKSLHFPVNNYNLKSLHRLIFKVIFALLLQYDKILHLFIWMATDELEKHFNTELKLSRCSCFSCPKTDAKTY